MKKVLVANRGEIALRVMRSVKEMGMKSVAVYSEADRFSPHVLYADEAICLGPSPSSDSYLRGDKIIEACKKLNVDAIHPGYGFLSENAEFTRAVNESGIEFIGPSARSIEMMGDKLSAKAVVKEYNVPMVPGTDYAIDNIEEAKDIAKVIGFPVLIKASAGGGGKGMRVVESPNDFEEQMGMAVSEAVSSFGNGAVFIEKYISSPRHIEIQVLADKQGNVVHLFERECSIQRRHQKVVEEAPSSILTESLRSKMGECAVNVAKSCEYVGAGTVEFLLDEQMNFYFLEMNTRLQVEHPVTEMITGLDLVKQQILVAKGEELAFKQVDISISGHAIEVRVYAEDPRNNFLPDIGVLTGYSRPSGIGVRVDDGFEEGMEIPIFYDSMISKLITYGADRTEAIGRMSRAISDYKIVGIQTTLPFGAFVMKHPFFISGDFDTHFIPNHYNSNLHDSPSEMEKMIAAWYVSKLFNDYLDTSVSQLQSDQSIWRKNRS